MSVSDKPPVLAAVKPDYKIGDLVWHKETKNGKLIWWPAMMTYDPHQGIYFKSSLNKCVQYHVQFFGSSAMRGWVSVKAIKELTSPTELILPEKGVSKKTRKEHDVAITEVTEAIKIDHKQRKLKFIFSFPTTNKQDSPSTEPKSPLPQADKTVPPPDIKPPRRKRARNDPVPIRTIKKQPRIMDSMKQTSPLKPNLFSFPSPVSPPLPLVPIIPIGSPPLMTSLPNGIISPLTHTPMMFHSPYQLSPIRQGTMLTVDQPPCLMDLTAALVPIQFESNPMALTFQPNFLPHQQLLPPILPQPVHTSTLQLESTMPGLSDPRSSYCPPLSNPPDYAKPTLLENVDSNSNVSAPSAILTPPSSCTDELTDSELTTSDTKPKARVKKEQSLSRGVCCICDHDGSDLLSCTGHCFSMFHLDCLGLMQVPTFKFVCDDCLLNSGKCFVCGESDNQEQLVKCNKTKCSKLYHLTCIADNKLFSFDERKKVPQFVCPLHACSRCKSIGVLEQSTANLIQCTKCPLALHRPNCLIAGCEILSSTHMVCYQHVKISTKSHHLDTHLNLNTCMDCGKIGSLFCCDVCSAAYHGECLEQESRPKSDADMWKCPSCAVHDLPTYGSMVLCKFGKWRWWPAEVVEPCAVPDNIEARSAGECMFVVRFCGTRDYSWMHHGRVVPYTGPSGEGSTTSYKGSKTPNNVYKKALLEAEELYKLKREAKEEQEAKHRKPDSKRYIKIKANKYLVPKPVVKESSLTFLPCQCSSDQPCNDDSSCVNRASHIECEPDCCPVGDLCQNQRLLGCKEAKTTPFYTGKRGWGLRVDHDLSAGDFVVEYIGEVLDTTMCHERLEKYHENRIVNFYMLTLDGRLVIDASQKSNHARFINHSCGPNCESQKWTVKGETRIGIFACVDIPAGTELTFDYHLDSLGNDKKQCLCGSKNCSGFMGLKSTKVTTSSASEKAKKPLKRKRPKKKEKVLSEVTLETDTHEDDCFECGDGGELLLCDSANCPKAYHLACLQRKVFPPKNNTWKCPRHFCRVCQKDAHMFCSSCPISYCKKHTVGKFGPSEDGLRLCLANCTVRDTTESPPIEAVLPEQ